MEPSVPSAPQQPVPQQPSQPTTAPASSAVAPITVTSTYSPGPRPALTPEQTSYVDRFSFGALAWGIVYPFASRLSREGWLSLIPLYNIYIWFRLMASGRRMSWERGMWDSFDTYRNRQRVLDISGIVVLGSVVVFVALTVVASAVLIPRLEFRSGSRTVSTSTDAIARMAVATSSDRIATTIADDVHLEIAETVVNIYCPHIDDPDSGYSGSGTIIDPSGLVITNSHVIPQDETYLYTDERGCMVALPDPETGRAKEIYWAEPVVVPGISDEYDIAYLEIYAAYEDEDGETYGRFPKSFPTFDDAGRCEGKMRLGEPVRIYGYPGISGGYSLTVTEGIISSFPEDGFIVTSAKIGHGNSGGLAVDAKGCMLGIPSMVSVDDAESLGVIISMSRIREFDAAVEALLEE